MNNCVFSGNLGKDAEQKVFGENNIVSFSIAVTKKGFTKKDGSVVPDKTTWLNCVKWNAGGLLPYLVKGQKVGVVGELEINEHEGKYYTQLVCREIELLGSKQEQQAPQIQPQYQQKPATPPPSGDMPEMPF